MNSNLTLSSLPDPNPESFDLLSDEKIEFLGKNIKIIVSKDHHATEDSIILAKFSSPKPNDITADLGTGCGIIPLIWFAAKSSPKYVTAIDISQSACNMLKKSVFINGFQEKISVINSDIKKTNAIPFAGKYSIAVCNPPYKATGTGKQSISPDSRCARHETSCTIKDVVKVASEILKNGGDLYMCHRTERLTDVTVSMRESGIEPKILRFVHCNPQKPSKLFLIKGKKGSGSGMICKPPLVIRNNNGDYSDEMMDIMSVFNKNV